METLNFFSVNFNNNDNKFLTLGYGCRNDVALLDKFDANEVSILNFKKHAFTDRVFTLVLVHRKQFVQLKKIFICCNIY